MCSMVTQNALKYILISLESEVFYVDMDHLYGNTHQQIVGVFTKTLGANNQEEFKRKHKVKRELEKWWCMVRDHAIVVVESPIASIR